MAKQNKPAIRFKGFTDAWEQRKVGELIEDYIEKTTVQNQYPVLTSSQQQGVVFQEDYFADRQVTTNDNIGYYVLPYGYFTYRSRSDTDVFIFNRNNIIDKGIISYYYPVFLPKDCDSNFLLRRLNHGIKKQLSMAAEGTGQKVLAHNKFKNMIVDVPEIEEQQKIGLYFESLDHLITLHQRKYDKLQVLKKAMLEKMFPKNGSSVPEIRFKGFTDAWEQRKLGEVVERITRKNENLESTLPLTISAQYGLINQNEFFDKRIASKDVSGYFLVRNGEFAYNKSTSSDAPWGAIKRLDRYESGVLSTLYIVFKILDERKTSSDYIVTYYNTDLWHKGIQAIAAEGARNHGLLNVAPADFFETNLTMPKDYAEQQQIGSFFQQLDHLITLHQRELEKLQNIKKSMLEKMFV
ncbi:MAG: restriction endonuclease subunit S [Escherichia coli]|nr:restriction endonuclease subunit S [Escherichia coli]